MDAKKPNPPCKPTHLMSKGVVKEIVDEKGPVRTQSQRFAQLRTLVRRTVDDNRRPA
jgi:hypothetical protein